MRFLCVPMLALAYAGCDSRSCGDEIPYDGIDQDCNGSDLTDVDGDGFDASQVLGPDCNDNDPQINPGEVDTPYDGIDQDCSGTDLIDADDDGHNGLAADGDDCDDTDPLVFPGQPDTVGDGVDQNCDGVDGEDIDGDGFASRTSGGNDCNDSVLDGAGTYPGAPEIWYDSIDQNCDGGCDFDQDADGFVLAGHDVADNSPCDADPEFGTVDAPVDCNDEDAQATDNFVLGTTPFDGETDVFGAAPVLVKLVHTEPNPTLVVFDPGGTEVAGITSFVNTDFQFAPAVSFDTFTTYDAEFEGSCGLTQFSFTTGAYGPPTNAAALRNTSFVIDLTQGDWLEPFGLGVSLGAAVDRGMLLGVGLANSSLIVITQATAAAGEQTQDVCIETEPFGTADFYDNPVLSVGPAEQGFLALTTGVIPITELTVDGLFTPDGTQLGVVSVSGVVDSRDLTQLLAPGGDDQAVCDLEASRGGSCLACADGTGDFCLAVLVEGLSGSVVAGETVVARTAADIAADAACD